MIRIVYEVAGRYPAILRCPPGHSLTHILHFNFLQQRHRHTPHHLHHQPNNYLLLTTVVGEVSTPIIISWNFLFNLYITRTLPCLSKCLMHLIFIWIFWPYSLFSWKVQGRYKEERKWQAWLSVWFTPYPKQISKNHPARRKLWKSQKYFLKGGAISSGWLHMFDCMSSAWLQWHKNYWLQVWKMFNYF